MHCLATSGRGWSVLTRLPACRCALNTIKLHSGRRGMGIQQRALEYLACPLLHGLHIMQLTSSSTQVDLCQPAVIGYAC